MQSLKQEVKMIKRGCWHPEIYNKCNNINENTIIEDSIVIFLFKYTIYSCFCKFSVI